MIVRCADVAHLNQNFHLDSPREAESVEKEAGVVNYCEGDAQIDADEQYGRALALDQEAGVVVVLHDVADTYDLIPAEGRVGQDKTVEVRHDADVGDIQVHTRDHTP